MKHIVTLLFILLVSLIQVQAQYLRGMHKNTATGEWKFVSINVQSGKMDSLATVPNLSSLYGYPATLNNNLQEYYFIGYDTTNTRTLYVLDEVDGTVKNEIPLPDVFAIWANESDGMLYGFRVISSTEPVKINPANGTVTTLSGINLSSHSLSLNFAGSDINYSRSEFYLGGENITYQEGFFVLNLTGSGSLTSNPIFDFLTLRTDETNDSIYGIKRKGVPGNYTAWQFFSFSPTSPQNVNIVVDSMAVYKADFTLPYFTTIDRSLGLLYFTASPDTGKIRMYEVNVHNGQTLKMFDIGTLQIPAATSLPPSISRNHIEGSVFFDKNGNGKQDGGEGALLNQPLTVQPGNFNMYSSATGKYSLPVGTGTFQVTVNPTSQFSLTTSPSTYNITFNGVGKDSLNNNFGLNTKGVPNDDASAHLTTSDAATYHLNTNLSHWINYANNGNTFLDGKIIYTYDTIFIYHSAVPVPDSVVGNKIYWGFKSLYPSEGREIEILLSNPPNMHTIGKRGCSDLEIDYSSTWPQNVKIKHDTACQIIKASYDPNEKDVSPDNPDGVKAGTRLTYTIHFQNTGNAAAHYVEVQDALSPLLDRKSFHMEGSSHPYTVYTDDANNIVWDFPNIVLPDSGSDFDGSRGFVSFSINADSTSAPGSSITNSAAIYFDANAPVITNITQTLISNPNGINQPGIGNTQLVVYPNPSDGRFQLQLNSINEGSAMLEITNILGTSLMRKTITVYVGGNKIAPDIKLNPGIYLLRVNTGETLMVKKLIVE